MSSVISVCRKSRETTYNLILCLLGGVFWAAMIYDLFLSDAASVAKVFSTLAFPLLIALFFFISALLFRAIAMGNMVLITEDQFPHLYEKIVAGAKKLNMPAPEAFIFNSNGMFNAFARKAFGRKYLLLTSAIVDATTDEQINFIIGHELGHHAAGHLNFWTYLLRFPATLIPFLYLAYSRQREYTCDRVGLYLSKDAKSSCEALQMLGCGCQKFNGKLNVASFASQEKYVPKATGFITEIVRTHPRLTRRVIALENAKLAD